jgi:hypothetical protein
MSSKYKNPSSTKYKNPSLTMIMVDYIDWKMTTFYETNKQTNQNLIIQTSDITFNNDLLNC